MMVRNIPPHPGAVDDLITKQVTATSLNLKLESKINGAEIGAANLPVYGIWSVLASGRSQCWPLMFELEMLTAIQTLGGSVSPLPNLIFHSFEYRTNRLLKV